MIRRPPRSTLDRSSAASDVYTRQEYGYASVDLFTCGDSVNPWKGFKYLENALSADRSESTEVSRGLVDKIRTFGDGEYNNLTITHKMEV